MLDTKKIREYDPAWILKPGSIIRIANRMLYNINKAIVTHNERTAYLALKIAQNHKLNSKCSLQNLVILSLFHTIGFFQQDFYYHTNPFDSNIDLFSYSKSIESKYIFGCYYLEFLTPLKKDALALEYLNHTFDPIMKESIYQYEYKSIIFLCAKISDYIKKNPDQPIPENLDSLAPGKFDPEYVALFKNLNKNNQLIDAINNHSYEKELSDYLDTITLSGPDTQQYLKFLVYILDFKSTVTYTHAVNTACYAYSIGKRLELSSDELAILFISALLHDIGKIAIPISILEKPGKLSPEEMGYMQRHVRHSKKIIQDLVPPIITETVYAHHEKLTGTGYPEGLKGDEISQLARALTVADVTSALVDKRSYKEEFNIDRTTQIIYFMAAQGELDPVTSQIITNDYDEIKQEMEELQKTITIGNFSDVIARYNDYIFNNPESITANVLEEKLQKAETTEEKIIISNCEKVTFTSNINIPIHSIKELEELEELEEI